MRATLKLQASPMGLQAAATRAFATSSRSVLPARVRSQNIIHSSGSSILRQSSRRGYAELKPTAPIEQVKKPKRFRALRWTWRLTYLSVIGGAAYMTYGVYELRHPEDQFEPDATKQNLVILGMYARGRI